MLVKNKIHEPVWHGFPRVATIADMARRTGKTTEAAPVRRKTFLREWRKYCRLSQEAAAESLDLTQGNLSKIERGEVPYNQDFLERAATVYGCTAADLLSVNPMKQEPLDSAFADARRAPEEVQRRVVNVVNALIKPEN